MLRPTLVNFSLFNLIIIVKQEEVASNLALDNFAHSLPILLIPKLFSQFPMWFVTWHCRFHLLFINLFNFAGQSSAVFSHLSGDFMKPVYNIGAYKFVQDVLRFKSVLRRVLSESMFLVSRALVRVRPLSTPLHFGDQASRPVVLFPFPLKALDTFGNCQRPIFSMWAHN